MPITLHTVQVAAVIPLLRVATRAKLIFYGHFPDLLLALHSSPIRRAYRAPFDALEAVSTGAADRLLVNSAFTQRVYRATFGTAIGERADVLYPCVRIPPVDALAADRSAWRSGACCHLLRSMCFVSWPVVADAHIWALGTSR